MASPDHLADLADLPVLPGLSRSDDDLPRIGAPAPADPAAAGIIHLGLGAFHRAHAAVHTARALAAAPGNWGIIGFANRSRSVVDPMARQHGRYGLLELSDAGAAAGILDVHRGFGVMAEEPDAVVREIADPRRRILTLTVSEAGYCLSPRTGRLDAELPLVAHDLRDPEHPHSVPGMIARGLALRAARSGEPFAVLPCDNVSGAGAALRAAVLELLERTGAPESALAFAQDSVGFPNAMVDRIVPATTPETSARIAQLLGVRDAAPVRTERFSMWVMQDDFPGGRPAWEHGGAVFSEQVERYEEVKLRVLNGPHSLLAYLGALDGRRIIPESFDQDWVARATLALIRTEMLPTITLPDDLDVPGYVRELEHRWQNHELGHRTAQVGSDGSMRLPQRLPGPALAHLRAGRMPHLIALTVAAWFACVIPPRGFDPGPEAQAMSDPEAARLRALVAEARSAPEHARLLLASGVLSGELAEQEAFADRVGELLEIIVGHGPRAAAEEALAAAAPAPVDPSKETRP